MKHNIFIKKFCISIIVIAFLIFLLKTNEVIVYAEGLVDETINSNNLYSMYPLKNYQLDFYVDNSWGWLPWNWSDGIGKSVQYGLYCITNFLWIISLYLSNATGYVVQEAYRLDFINDMADAIGKSIQTIAGINQNGFSNTGFYIGFLLLLILIVGVYVAYTGLIKKETSKAISSVVNFIVVFIVSASCIAYAPEYIKKVNEFSSDISKAALTLGTDIMIPNSNSEGKDSIDLIRDNLFSIQVKQPWLILQYGNSNIKELGEERVEELLSTSPSENDGETREEVVKREIEDKGNNNLTIPEVINRLGIVLFLLIFNLGITIFVFLLVSMMIFSQILFIIFAVFLPISFLFSMIPTYESMGRKAIVKLFNTIMMRAGITLIITVAFSISTMFYTISTGYPFFMIAFLQIVTFAGIYLKLGDIMGMFSLQSGDSRSLGRYILRKPYVAMRNRSRKLEHSIREAFGDKSKIRKNNPQKKLMNPQDKRKHDREIIKTSCGERMGNTVGLMRDKKKKVGDKSRQLKENIQGIPTHVQYAAYNAKEKVKENISDFKRGIVEEREKLQNERDKKLQSNRLRIGEKRAKLDNIEVLKKNKEENQKQKAVNNNKRPLVSSDKAKYKSQENIRGTISSELDNKIKDEKAHIKNNETQKVSQKERSTTSLKDKRENVEGKLKKEPINKKLNENGKRYTYRINNEKQIKYKTDNKLNKKVETK
ncbi:CD3337/EF1877 family mobilome membrane protein [Clostridium perfringens]|uniref:CD3337/EF1877 family mobilome membrane protein n=1 Tax=Clostridium perfringens TaxID=1502 RepID=UPI0024BD4622|nr:YtxH domain-containing protein [Clostridium perfringens]